MSIKFNRIRYFGVFSVPGVLFCLIFLCAAVSLEAQSEDVDLPDPIKFRNKFDVVANAVRAVLKESHDIELDDRQAGRIITRPYEFITGSLTADEAAKVAIIKNKGTGSWIKARYSIEATLEIVSPTETLVTVHANIEALNQDISGTERWIPLDSRGTLEKRVLGKVSGILMGKPDEGKKEGFWGQRPQPVDSRPSRFPSPPDR